MDVRRIRGISDHAAHLLLILLLSEGKARSVSFLVDTLGCSVSAVYRSADRLLELGLIVKMGLAPKVGGGREALFQASPDLAQGGASPIPPSEAATHTVFELVTPPPPSSVLPPPPVPTVPPEPPAPAQVTPNVLPQPLSLPLPTPSESSPRAVVLARQADAAQNIALKQQALQHLWQEHFHIRLTNSQAGELLALAGSSAENICLWLEEAVQTVTGRIEYPIGFTKAVLRKRMERSGGREEREYPDEFMRQLVAFQREANKHIKEEE